MSRPATTKVSKKLEDLADQTPELEIRLELHDPNENHNKFWTCLVFHSEGEQIYVVRHWGRNFTKGQSMVEQLWNNYNAVTYAKEMAFKKEREGYKPIKNFLDQLAREL